MQSITVENILTHIERLPIAERIKLLQTLEPQVRQLSANGLLDELVSPKPLPDSTREMKWIAEHRRPYAGQWVALDGDRLIAHGPEARAVYAAANADGAYLPMVTFIPDPDKPSSILWA